MAKVIPSASSQSDRTFEEEQKVTKPAISSPEPLPETIQPASELPDLLASSSTTPSIERRQQARASVDSLVYLSLGEENGGILLDIDDTGFCMQTALPLDSAARVSGTHGSRATVILKPTASWFGSNPVKPDSSFLTCLLVCGWGYKNGSPLVASCRCAQGLLFRRRCDPR